MTIGQVARKAGIRASAIRFYERAGLLPRPDRAAGQRRYDDMILNRLALVEFAKGCGFTIDEIRRLLLGLAGNPPLSVRIRGLAAAKIRELDVLAARLEIMKSTLARAERCGCADLDECGRRLRAGANAK